MAGEPPISFQAGRAADPRPAGRDLSFAPSLVFIAAVAAGSVLAGRVDVAVYALGFWHYLLYALAFTLGAVPPARFRRDAALMKTVSLAAFAAAYLAAPLDFLSIGIAAAGFLLNLSAARALGAERTYYGVEIAALPELRVTAFPYSLLPHPMLIGNMTAFGATLINGDFRRDWWPLACAHVALNLALLAMETQATPRRGRPLSRRDRRALAAMVATGAGAAVLLFLPTAAGLALAAAVAAHAGILCLSYARATIPETGGLP